MKSLKLKLSFALLIIGTACYVAYLEVQASGDSDEQINSAAVWSSSAANLTAVNQSCAKEPAQNYVSCFVARMTDLGASEEAVSFARDYAGQNGGRVAILQDFHPLDAVDLGYVYFPGSSQQTRGWLLLNGYPSVINVDDLQRLPKDVMEKNPGWTKLRSKYPAVAISAEDAERSRDKMPEITHLPDGSERFTVQYALRNGCNSCELVGHATFSFDFDPSGELVLVRFVSISPVE